LKQDEAPVATTGNLAASVLFGILCGFIFGVPAFVAFVLFGVYLSNSLPGSWSAVHARSISWLVETALIVGVLIWIFRPRSRVPLFVRAFAASFAVIALGGLAICDVMAVVDLTGKSPGAPSPLKHR
jgi:hypothetical protein